MPDELHSLRYARWDDRFAHEKPYVVISDIQGLPEDRKTNISFMNAPEEIIHDVRGHEEDFNLDENGFVFIKHKFSDFDVYNPGLVEKFYKTEVEKFLKSKVDGVDQVVFFDHRV
jgi:hypothetical protein